MNTSQKIEKSIPQIHDQTSFIQELLINALGWPVDKETRKVEEITYGWSADELRAQGLKKEIVDGTIHQIQPFPDNPWSIFILEFKNDDLFIKNRGLTSKLRKLLRGLVISRNKSSHLASFDMDKLLFICTYNYQHYRFAHFKKAKQDSANAPLAFFGWGPGDPIRTLCEYNLQELAWPKQQLDENNWLLSWQKAFDVEKVNKRFYDDYEKVFETVQSIIAQQKNHKDEDELHTFTQTLFNRLMFIRFIERKGWLTFEGSQVYLKTLYNAGGAGKQSLYKYRLCPLFFEALAEKNKQKTDKRFGSVPFLNGGLFYKDKLDLKFRDIDIPDQAFEPLIGQDGLFYRYNFTIEESTPLDIEVAIDPEMMGKVFERLITKRHQTGTYYTPHAVVRFMCREALKNHLGGYADLVDKRDVKGITVIEAKNLLKKLGNIKIVDPACGSGAYLVGMMHELHEISRALDTWADKITPKSDYNRKLDIIKKNLYGVDIDPQAVQIARLRFWLSLEVDYSGNDPRPLPNLDFKIEEGNSLTAPNPSGGMQPGFHQEIIRQFDMLKSEYQTIHDREEKKVCKEKIKELRNEIAKWAHPGQQVPGLDWRVEFAEVFTRQDAAGFDVVIANPPYGTEEKEADRLRKVYFAEENGGKQSKEPYGLFIARALQLLCSGGQFTFIVSDTWRTIRSHLPLRKKLCKETTVKHVLDLPSWIFDATVNTCILTLQNSVPSGEHKLIAGDLRNIEDGNWEQLEKNLDAVSAHTMDVQTTDYARYTYKQKLIAEYENYSFFIGSPRLYRLMSDKQHFEKLDDVADVKVGLQTGNNKYYLRKRKHPGENGQYQALDESKLLMEQEIYRLTDDEKINGVDPAKYNGRYFVPYDKGGASEIEEGWLPNYYVPTEYFIDWSRKAVKRLKIVTIADVKRRKGEEKKIKNGDENKIASRFQNSEYYFQEGVTFSRTGIYAPTYRRSSRSVFDTEGSVVFSSQVSNKVLLGLLSSHFGRYIVKCFLNHTVHAQIEDVKKMIIVNPEKMNKNKLEKLVESITEKQKNNPEYPYFLHEQKEIDKLVYQLYGLSEEAIREVELWYCRRYRNLTKTQGVLEKVQKMQRLPDVV
ncbi:N-6 DNA methylase [bacterium]|nr:N-6 DNA methylase [bacterium]